MRYTKVATAIILAVLAAAPAATLAGTGSNPATADRISSQDYSKLSDMTCIQQLDQIGNFVRMLCVSPNPRYGGKMRYNPPARNDGEVWQDLGRQRSLQPFWN